MDAARPHIFMAGEVNGESRCHGMSTTPHTTSTFAQSNVGLLPSHEGSLSSTKRSRRYQPSEPPIKATHVFPLLPIIFYYSAQIWPHVALLSLLSGTYLQTAIIIRSPIFSRVLTEDSADHPFNFCSHG